MQDYTEVCIATNLWWVATVVCNRCAWRVNVSIPDDVIERAREAGLNSSPRASGDQGPLGLSCPPSTPTHDVCRGPTTEVGPRHT
jgi:hypothetical protein